MRTDSRRGALKNTALIAFAGTAAAACWLLHERSEREERRHLKREQALEEASRRKDRFLALVGHEIRNPLAAILGAARLLRRPISEERRALVIEALERQAQKLSRVVDDFLDLSRMARGKIELERRTVSISSVLEKAVTAVQGVITDKNQTLKTTAAEEIVLTADPERLQQVVVNLLNNASRNSGPGGRIEVSVVKERNTLSINVTDCGTPIPADSLAGLFDPSSTAAQGYQSQSLGLSVAQHIAELHGGTIRVHRRPEGKGNKFSAHIPLSR